MNQGGPSSKLQSHMPFPVHSLRLLLLVVDGGSSQLSLLRAYHRLPQSPAVMCVLLFLWNDKPRLPSRSCLAHGVLSENRKVANTPAYRLSSTEKKDEHPVCKSQGEVRISLPCYRKKETRTWIHQCYKVVGRCIGPGVLSREDLSVFQWVPTS